MPDGSENRGAGERTSGPAHDRDSRRSDGGSVTSRHAVLSLTASTRALESTVRASAEGAAEGLMDERRTLDATG